MSDLVKLGPAHAGLAAGMHHVCFDAPWSETAMAELLILPGFHGWLATDEGRPQGLVMARVAADEAEILTLLVLPPARRQGLARRLLDASVDSARRQGAETMYLEVASSNQAAQALYAKLGFGEVGRRKAYYASGADALVLAKAI